MHASYADIALMRKQKLPSLDDDDDEDGEHCFCPRAELLGPRRGRVYRLTSPIPETKPSVRWSAAGGGDRSSSKTRASMRKRLGPRASEPFHQLAPVVVVDMQQISSSRATATVASFWILVFESMPLNCDSTDLVALELKSRDWMCLQKLPCGVC